MSEAGRTGRKRFRRIRHRGRGSQVLIYLGKQLRFFINESDWKVLPMAGIIAALVGMVIRNKFFVNMEGSLIGAFALTCVAIWNGCFNSIQSVCRERAIIKREHRSGMHISSYVTAHMIYQFLLCAAQTALTMYVLKLMNVRFPDEGFMTSWMIVDIGISILLISYASDMMSLFLSSIAHTTTAAMTIMPFMLIFQLVFSGGIIPLPAWSQSLSDFTISNYGIKVIAAQTGYNELPMETAWKTLDGMRNEKIEQTFTVGQVLDLLDSPVVEKRREKEIVSTATLQQLLGFIDPALAPLAEEPLTVGTVIDLLKSFPELQAERDRAITVSGSVGELIELFGEENVKTMVQQKTAAASRKQDYEQSAENIIGYWVMLIIFVLVFSLLSMLVLERIDHDKR